MDASREHVLCDTAPLSERLNSIRIAQAETHALVGGCAPDAELEIAVRTARGRSSGARLSRGARARSAAAADAGVVLERPSVAIDPSEPGDEPEQADDPRTMAGQEGWAWAPEARRRDPGAGARAPGPGVESAWAEVSERALRLPAFRMGGDQLATTLAVPGATCVLPRAALDSGLPAARAGDEREAEGERAGRSRRSAPRRGRTSGREGVKLPRDTVPCTPAWAREPDEAAGPSSTGRALGGGRASVWSQPAARARAAIAGPGLAPTWPSAGAGSAAEIPLVVPVGSRSSIPLAVTRTMCYPGDTAIRTPAAAAPAPASDAASASARGSRSARASGSSQDSGGRQAGRRPSNGAVSERRRRPEPEDTMLEASAIRRTGIVSGDVAPARFIPTLIGPAPALPSAAAIAASTGLDFETRYGASLKSLAISVLVGVSVMAAMLYRFL